MSIDLQIFKPIVHKYDDFVSLTVERGFVEYLSLSLGEVFSSSGTFLEISNVELILKLNISNEVFERDKPNDNSTKMVISSFLLSHCCLTKHFFTL
jgi:hypothetical protein